MALEVTKAINVTAMMAVAEVPSGVTFGLGSCRVHRNQVLKEIQLIGVARCLRKTLSGNAGSI